MRLSIICQQIGIALLLLGYVPRVCKYSYLIISYIYMCFQDPHKELTGQNVLIVRGSMEKTATTFNLEEAKAAELLKDCRERLFKHRQERPKPHRDDKILTAWNGKLSSCLGAIYSR